MDLKTVATVLGIIVSTIGIMKLMMGGSWNLSKKITSIEANLIALQNETKRLADVLIDIADLRGDLKVFNTRLTAAEQDIRELRHGQGFIRGPHGVEREYP